MNKTETAAVFRRIIADATTGLETVLSESGNVAVADSGNEGRWMDIGEAASATGRCPSTIYRRVKDGSLESRRLGQRSLRVFIPHWMIKK